MDYNRFMSSRRGEEKATNVLESGEFLFDLQRERDGRRGGTEECDECDKEVEEESKRTKIEEKKNERSNEKECSEIGRAHV